MYEVYDMYDYYDHYDYYDYYDNDSNYIVDRIYIQLPPREGGCFYRNFISLNCFAAENPNVLCAKKQKNISETVILPFYLKNVSST